jgi:4-aminobutyrate aminotransferase-like enzyme
VTVARSSRLLSTSLTLSEEVPHVTGAQGAWFELSDGRRVIDGSNTSAPLGHGHPEVVEAVRRAASAPILNEGLGWREREQAAEDLVNIAFGGEQWLGAVRFFVSASEANDVALALCQALTGRAALATRERAYHGGAGLAREMTVQPQWHGGLSSPSHGVKAPPRLATVHELPAPRGARIGGDGLPTDTSALARASGLLEESAAVILDYSQGGIYHEVAYQDQVAELAKAAGTLWIADETVTGFGRVGGWFQFQASATRPDFVTMGKSLAAGGAPAGAVLVSKRVLDAMSDSAWQSYSTFRGHPLQVAAISAHLRVSARERVFERARGLDGFMLARLERVAAAHPSVARIDGRGLHWTVELHGPDWRSWRGEEAEPTASRVVSRALEAGALFSTSGEQTSLFIAPPLVISEDELEHMFEALEQGLLVADRELERVAT